MSSNDDNRETFLLETPPQELYTSIGIINYCWAELDAMVTASLVATTGIGAIETCILMGRLDERAKVQRLSKIFSHRSDKERFEVLKNAAKVLENQKDFRNAITHGKYLGVTKKGEYLWSLFPNVTIGSTESTTELFVAEIGEFTKHATEIMSIVIALRDLFEPSALGELFAVPSYVPGRSPGE